MPHNSVDSWKSSRDLLPPPKDFWELLFFPRTENLFETWFFGHRINFYNICFRSNLGNGQFGSYASSEGFFNIQKDYLWKFRTFETLERTLFSTGSRRKIFSCFDMHLYLATATHLHNHGLPRIVREQFDNFSILPVQRLLGATFPDCRDFVRKMFPQGFVDITWKWLFFEESYDQNILLEVFFWDHSSYLKSDATAICALGVCLRRRKTTNFFVSQFDVVPFFQISSFCT